MAPSAEQQPPPTPSGMPASLRAHSRFIKRSTCEECGAPKTLPSKTAYLYCDYCGALVDYDFRVANAGTNAGITNTVYEQIVAPYQVAMAQAKASRDYPGYRQIMLYVFQEWIKGCPEAVSPRAKTDLEFRDRMIRYCAECAVVKDLDPDLQQLDAQMRGLMASFQRIPQEGGAWLVWGDNFWLAADLWKRQMDQAYALLKDYGVTAMDPDDPPRGVALKMEYSVFCQAWLPHLTPQDGARLLALYGMTDDYVEVPIQQTEKHQCGGCGVELETVVGARVVVCEDCGYQIEVGSPAVPCRQCGAPLSFPVGKDRLACPYCRSDNSRV